MKIKTSYNISVSISIKSLESSILASLNRRGQTTLKLKFQIMLSGHTSLNKL